MLVVVMHDAGVGVNDNGDGDDVVEYFVIVS